MAAANPTTESADRLRDSEFFDLRFMSAEEEQAIASFSQTAGISIEDDGGRPVPIGAIGHIRAHGVASPGNDLGRWREDGVAECPVSAAQPRAVYVAPRDALEWKLAQIWEEVLGVHPIGIRDNFFDLGGYSLSVAHLFQRLSRVFHAHLTFTLLFRAPTIEMLAAFLRQHTGRPWYSPLVPVQPHGSEIPLFMVHSYLLYNGLPRALGWDQPFYGLQEPPVERRSPPYRLEDMLAPYVAAIREVQPQGPYQLAGWCAAGIHALEVARQLELAGERVGALCLIDAWCPVPPPSAQSPPRAPLRRAAHTRLREVPERLRLIVRRFGVEAGDRLWHSLASPWIDAGRSLPAPLRNASKLTEASTRRYHPAQVHCPVFIVRATEGTFEPYQDASCGWQPWTTCPVEILPVPGDHVTMFHQPNLAVTASRIRERLAQVR